MKALLLFMCGRIQQLFLPVNTDEVKERLMIPKSGGRGNYVGSWGKLPGCSESAILLFGCFRYHKFGPGGLRSFGPFTREDGKKWTQNSQLFLGHICVKGMQKQNKTESDLVWQHVACEITVPQKSRCWFFPNFITSDAAWSWSFQRKHWIIIVLLGAQPGARSIACWSGRSHCRHSWSFVPFSGIFHPFFTVQGTIQICSVVAQVALLVTVNLAKWNIHLLCPDFYPNFVNFNVF